jgi:hypothetical protein
VTADPGRFNVGMFLICLLLFAAVLLAEGAP